jgi:hypothetical protein
MLSAAKHLLLVAALGRAVKKSGISGLAHTLRCAFSGAIASLADLKGLRQPNSHTF